MGCNKSKTKTPKENIRVLESLARPIQTETREKLQAQSSFRSAYKEGRELGKGNYSTVVLATHIERGDQVAVKRIKEGDLTEEDKAALKFEIEILRTLDHPHIIKFYDFYIERPMYYIVMEYVSGGELFDRIVEKEYYSEKDAAKVIKTVSLALKHCHDRGIVHRDLKPENLLLTKNEKGVVEDGNIKLADFGFAKSLIGVAGGLTTSCGTPGYVAPEILRGDMYGKEVDLWSLGVILYVLLCGYPPFIEEGNTGLGGLFQKIKSGSYSFTPEEYWKDVSKAGKNLIRQLLKLNPAERITIDEVLKNDWVRMDELEQKPETNDITSALAQMKKYQARKKWRMGFNAITAANRISQLTKNGSRGSSAERATVPVVELNKEGTAEDRKQATDEGIPKVEEEVKPLAEEAKINSSPIETVAG